MSGSEPHRNSNSRGGSQIIRLYRKRIIPEECIPLKDDIVLYSDDTKIVTQWTTLRPKRDFDNGRSCYFLKEGYKVSRFMSGDDLVYWYCDIIDYEYQEESDTYIFRDLLADVVVYPDGFVKVMDLDEFEQALEAGSLTSLDVRKALRSLSELLKIIYDGRFDTLTKELTI